MKKAILCFVAFAVCAASVFAQSPAPQAATWVVNGSGCPAASTGLPSVLASQWTAALSAESSSTTETALVNATQSYVTARIAAYLAANPQQIVTVRVARPAATSGLALQIFISASAPPAGSTCPTS